MIVGWSSQVVAVKQLDRNGLQGNREFLVEVLMLSLLHHPNLVNLIGYCADGDQRLLVYEFMPLGSLEDHLHGNLFCMAFCFYDLYFFYFYVANGLYPNKMQQEIVYILLRLSQKRMVGFLFMNIKESTWITLLLI